MTCTRSAWMPQNRRNESVRRLPLHFLAESISMVSNMSAHLRRQHISVLAVYVFVLASIGGCSSAVKHTIHQKDRLKLKHEKQEAARHFLKMAEKSVQSLKKGQLIEGYIYNTLHLLETYDELGLSANDPLVADAKKTLAKIYGKNKRFPFDAFGCMPQAALSGLCHSGTDKSADAVVKTTERWYGMFETQWKHEGWGECKTPGIQMTWGVAKGQKPFAEKLNCNAPDLEYTMKTFHAFARCGRHDLVEKAIAGYNAEDKISRLVIKEHFWETDGLSWVIFAFLEGVSSLENAAKEADKKIADVLAHLDEYPDVKASPLLLCNMTRAHVLLNKKVDNETIQTLRHILTFGKQGVYPITTLRKFAGDYSEEYSGSGSWGVALLLDTIEKNL